ncbi:hypothetical protein D3C72_1884820 [compost metagenome]
MMTASLPAVMVTLPLVAPTAERASLWVTATVCDDDLALLPPADTPIPPCPAENLTPDEERSCVSVTSRTFSPAVITTFPLAAVRSTASVAVTVLWRMSRSLPATAWTVSPLMALPTPTSA